MHTITKKTRPLVNRRFLTYCISISDTLDIGICSFRIRGPKMADVNRLFFKNAGAKAPIASVLLNTSLCYVVKLLSIILLTDGCYRDAIRGVGEEQAVMWDGHNQPPPLE